MHSFRTQLLASTAILVLSGAAYAADMPVKAPPPLAPVAPVINWTGFYVGAQFGGASLDPSCHTNSAESFGEALPCNEFSSDSEGAVSRSSSHSLSSAGVLGGGKIGYDWQGLLGWDRVVLGVVGEFDWTDLNSSSQIQSVDFEDRLATATANERLDWLASARVRGGWAFDNVLFYATGGVAWARIKESASVSGTFEGIGDFATPETSTTKTGAVAGGGFEYRVTPHVSVVGELLWYGFGSRDTSAVVHGTTYTTQFTNQDILAGTLGVNWRF
jgi:outer membrane immunogenic protein